MGSDVDMDKGMGDEAATGQLKPRPTENAKRLRLVGLQALRAVPAQGR